MSRQAASESNNAAEPDVFQPEALLLGKQTWNLNVVQQSTPSVLIHYFSPPYPQAFFNHFWYSRCDKLAIGRLQPGAKGGTCARTLTCCPVARLFSGLIGTKTKRAELLPLLLSDILCLFPSLLAVMRPLIQFSPAALSVCTAQSFICSDLHSNMNR